MAGKNIKSREELDMLLKGKNDYKKSVTQVRCRQCRAGYHYKIRGSWTRCNVCGYAGYNLC